MNTSEKFAKLDALVVETGISEEELNQWFEVRKTSAVASDVISTSSTGGIKSIFPIAYKKGNEFEILPELILERKDEVWGYEIMPNVILAKKCGADGNVENTNWYNAKAFAKKCVLMGKQGDLPFKEVLDRNWSAELKNKIKEMDKFLSENNIDAERKRIGIIWCPDIDFHGNALYFILADGYNNWSNKSHISIYDRLAVEF